MATAIDFNGLMKSNVLDKNGTVDVEKFTGAGKVVGLYFSAHWCPPCRGFTPDLVEFYNAMKSENFEIVFLSSDKNEDAFKDYFSSMPWLALNYGSEEKEQISQTFKITGIPSFVIVDGTGKLITSDGRKDVTTWKNDKTKPSWLN